MQLFISKCLDQTQQILMWTKTQIQKLLQKPTHRSRRQAIQVGETQIHNIQNLHVCKILSFIIITAADETSEKASAEDSTGKRDRVKRDRLYCIRWC